MTNAEKRATVIRRYKYLERQLVSKETDFIRFRYYMLQIKDLRVNYPEIVGSVK